MTARNMAYAFFLTACLGNIVVSAMDLAAIIDATATTTWHAVAQFLLTVAFLLVA
jgi:hypothetical protein